MAGLVPVVDLSGWSSGGTAARERVSAAVDAACSEVGFLQVTGHGLEDSLIGRMLDAADRLFDLPLETKMGYRPVSPEVNNGYSPVGSESLTYSLGVEDAPPDLFEAFNLGPDDPDFTDPAVLAERDRIFAPNRWPAELPEFRDVGVEYFAAVSSLAHRLTSVFAVALGMDEGFFEGFTRHSTDTLRINHYQRRPEMGDPLPGQARMGAHTDYGIVTLLYADRVPGLEIVGSDGAWHPVLPEPNAYLVNIGDLLAQWTNDRWRSTVHRVVPPPAGDGRPNRRRSLAFFHDGDWDAVVECLPTCCSAEKPARYEPVRAVDHLMNKLLGGRTMSAAEETDHIGDRMGAVRA